MECPPLQAFCFPECPQVSYTCQALLNKAPSKGGKEEERDRTKVHEPKMQKPKVRHNGSKGTNYVSDSPPAARSISQKEMEPERA
jgi:hypothetical protein